MKQQCYMAAIYLTWAVYLGGLVYLGYQSRWPLAAVWLIGVPLFEWIYIRKFPSLSKAMGYGPIADQPGETVSAARVKVTLYTAIGCPFCPLIERRLRELQRQMGFSLETVDVTLRPDILASKGIRSVPVVETRGRFLTGLVFTKDLAAAIGAAGPA